MTPKQEAVHAAAEAAQQLLNSPVYMQALARKIIREAAVNPGGFANRLVSECAESDFLTPPVRLADGGRLVLTLFPISDALCYSAICSAKEHEHDHDPELGGHSHSQHVGKRKGPTPVGDHDGDQAVAVEHQYSVIAYRDFPGYVNHNHLVELLPEEMNELQRQLSVLGSQGTRWFYLSKIEVNNDRAQ